MNCQHKKLLCCIADIKHLLYIHHSIHTHFKLSLFVNVIYLCTVLNGFYRSLEASTGQYRAIIQGIQSTQEMKGVHLIILGIMVDLLQNFQMLLLYSELLLTLGLKLLIGICCLAFCLFQCIELINNYNAKETLVKSSEIKWTGPLPTPMVVICSDPPHKELEEEEDIVTACHDDAESVSVRKITTMFKVLYLVHIIQIHPGQVT